MSRLRNWLANAAALASVIAIGLLLRPPSASIAPVLEAVRQDLALSHTSIGVLTALPVICLAVTPTLLACFIRKPSVHRWLFAAVLLIGLALGARVLSSASILYASAIAAGVGVGLIQVFLPMVIRERFEHSQAVAAVYATTVALGAAFALGATTHLVASVGSWHGALAAWGALVPFALAGCVVLSRQRALPAERSPAVDRGQSPWRDPTSWRIALFLGASSLLYWSITSWFPTVLLVAGLSQSTSSKLAGVLGFAQVLASVGLTLAIYSRVSRRLLIRGTLACAIVGLIGLALAAASAPWLWALLLGLGGGGLFPIATALPMAFSDTASHARLITGMSLSVGYLVAAPGPLVIGWLCAATGDFQIPLLVLAAALALLGGAALNLPDDIAHADRS